MCGDVILCQWLEYRTMANSSALQSAIQKRPDITTYHAEGSLEL